jgi:glycosyltransferase involved in cell wall biosynthesis
VTGRLLFDVTGLIHWYAFHSYPSGIQRVTEKLLRSAPVRQSRDVEYVARALGGDTFYRIDAAALRDPMRLRVLFSRSLGRARLRPLMNDLRWFHLPYLPLGVLAAVLPSLPAVPLPGPNDTLFNPGDLWWQRQFASFTLDLKARTGVRVVQMIHDLFVLERPDWFDPRFARDFTSVFPRLAPGVDRWLTNSGYVRGEVAAWLDGRALPACPIEVLPMGWDSFEKPNGGESAILRRYGVEGPFILFVGTVEPRKNLATLLDAMAALRSDLGARVPKLVVVGSYGWQAASTAGRLRRDPSVVWLRSVCDADLAVLYAQARFTVMPSFTEGWGLPVQESIAHGVPCIASSGGALREAGHGLAVHFDPSDAASLTSAMAAWITDPAALEAARANISTALRSGTFATWDDAGRTLLQQAR